jgi:hypothetical protein
VQIDRPRLECGFEVSVGGGGGGIFKLASSFQHTV